MKLTKLQMTGQTKSVPYARGRSAHVLNAPLHLACLDPIIASGRHFRLVSTPLTRRFLVAKFQSDGLSPLAATQANER